MIRLIFTLMFSAIGLLLVAPVFVLLVPVWIFCLLANGIGALFARRGASWSQILQFEPEIGWKPRPNLNSVYIDRVGDACTIKTDAEGWPGKHPIEESDVVVIGDSFAFGYGSAISRAYYAMTTGCRIKPIGAPGYNMVQELMLMKQNASCLKGKLVVWFACIENDLAENLKAYNPRLYTNPFLRKRVDDEDWRIVSEHVQPGGWLYGDGGTSNRVLFAHICTRSEYSDRIFSATEYLIREGKEICRAAGAELLIFSIPYKEQLSREGVKKLKKPLANPEDFDVNYPDKKLADICGRLSLPFIRGASHLTLRDYKIRDGHWSRRGNLKVGRMIESYYCENSSERRSRTRMPASFSPRSAPSMR